MNSTIKIASAMLLMVSSAAFAVGQTTAPVNTTPPSRPMVTAPSAPMADTKADIKAQKKQIRADKKAALAECKKLKGADKKACKKEAKVKEAAAMADLKAAK